MRDSPNSSAAACLLGGICALAVLSLLTAPGVRAAGKQPVVLLLPPSGFVLRAPEMLDAERAARRAGFTPEQLDYPLGNPVGAWRFVRRRARGLSRRGRTVVAYGESAGGTLAADLSVHGLSRYTVANSAVSNLLRWEPNPGFWAQLGSTRAQRRHLSPALHPARTPVLNMASPQDETVPYAMNRRWARVDPKVELLTFEGGHIFPQGDPAAYRRELRTAFGWLRKGVERSALAAPEPPPAARARAALLERIRALASRALPL